MRRDIFQAIADPIRRANLKLVALQAMTPNAMAIYFNSTRPVVSKLFEVLTEGGPLKLEQNGREIHYSLEVD